MSQNQQDQTDFQGSIMISFDGLELLPVEKELLQHPQTAGAVLFACNYHNPQQLTELTQQIYSLRPNALIAVDQEGGPVQRFAKGFTALPAMSHWGKLFDRDPKRAKVELQQTILTMARELKDCGINLDLMPVLDINQGLSQVIGERSLHSKTEVIVELAQVIIDALHAEKMPAVGKHFPGHGSVAVDSHKALPIDEREWQSIAATDLQPFKQLMTQLDAVMPAHIVYSQMDAEPAGFSRFWLQTVLREQLGFNGVIISDDLTMEGAASAGGYLERTRKALDAGCDLLLLGNHRGGNQAMQLEVLNSLQDHNDRLSQDRIKRLVNSSVGVINGW